MGKLGSHWLTELFAIPPLQAFGIDYNIATENTPLLGLLLLPKTNPTSQPENEQAQPTNQ